MEKEENFFGTSKEIVINDLQELLQKNHDAEKGFNTAEGASKNLKLKKFFKKQANQKNQFVEEINELVRSLDALPINKGSAKGKIHRAWMDMKAAISTNKDEALLKECVRGEKESEREYIEKLQKDHFPASISQILKRHVAEIRITIAQVSSLEDIADNKALGF